MFDGFTYVRYLWLLWPLCLLFLAGAALAAHRPTARRYAILTPVMVSLVMLTYVWQGVSTAWASIEMAGEGLSGISYGIAQASLTGLFFGVPIVLSCLAVAAPGAIEARNAMDERPESVIYGSLLLGAGALLFEGAAIAQVTGLTLGLAAGAGALGLLLWLLHQAAALETHGAVLFPVAMVAVWFAAVGGVSGSILQEMARSAPSHLGLGVDFWLVRLVVFTLGLGFAGLMGKRAALFAVPVVLGALFVGSTTNLLIGVNTPAAEGEDWKEAARRW